jgi:holin-like protein
MLGFAILLAYQLLGMLLQYGLHIPLPANVIGLALFTLSLFAGLIRMEWVEDSAVFLTRHMMLFFAPIVAGTVAFIPFIREHLATIGVALIGSWLSVLLVSALSTKWLQRSSQRSPSGELNREEEPA